MRSTTRWKAGVATGLVAFGGGAAALAATNGTTATASTTATARTALTGMRLHHGPGDLDAAATYLGITTTDLLTQLQAGKTLAEIANATSGKSADGLIAALLADAKQHITDLVNGKLPPPPTGAGHPDGDHDGPQGGLPPAA